MSGAERRPGVLLDVDGTLLDTNYLHVLAWCQAFRDAGHHDVMMARLHQLIGLTDDVLVKEVLGREDDAVVKGHSHHYQQLRDQVEAFPKVPELLSACADVGLAVVLVTSGKEEDLEWMLPAMGGGDELTGAITSRDVASSKPSPDPLGVAIDKHHLDPQRAVLVGDTVWDAKAGDHAELPCVALLCGGIAEQQLRDAGADEVHADPAALLKGIDRSLVVRHSLG